MRRTTLARGGALLTAATLAISLNAGPATADSTQTEKAPAVKSDLGNKTSVDRESSSPSNRAGGFVANALPGTADILRIGQYNVVLDEPGWFIYEGNSNVDSGVDGQPGDVNLIQSNLFVGGVSRGYYELGFNGATPAYTSTGIILPSTIKTGKARLGPSNIYYTDSANHPMTTDPTLSNYFYIRRYTKSTNTYGLVVTRSGSRITFKAQNWKIFQPSTGKYVPMNTMKLQYRYDGRWITKKTIELNSNGTGSYSMTTNTKRRYRLYYPTTDTIFGASTIPTGLI